MIDSVDARPRRCDPQDVCVARDPSATPRMLAVLSLSVDWVVVYGVSVRVWPLLSPTEGQRAALEHRSTSSAVQWSTNEK